MKVFFLEQSIKFTTRWNLVVCWRSKWKICVWKSSSMLEVHTEQLAEQCSKASDLFVLWVIYNGMNLTSYETAHPSYKFSLPIDKHKNKLYLHQSPNRSKFVHMSKILSGYVFTFCSLLLMVGAIITNIFWAQVNYWQKLICAALSLSYKLYNLIRLLSYPKKKTIAFLPPTFINFFLVLKLTL